MILVVGGIKGGSGKTTVATNLAVISAAEGKDVLLIDADDQETASDFTILRNENQSDRPRYTNIKLSGAAARTETQRLAPKYDVIVIDTGGRDTTSQRAALTVADALVVPFVPRSFDVWTLERVSLLVQEVRAVNDALQAFVFINRADPVGHDNSEAADLLREADQLQFMDAPIVTRKAFGNAAAAGLAVTELTPNDAKATREITRLYKRLFNVTSTLAVVGE